MIAILGILLVIIVIVYIEVPSLLKKGLKKELWVFGILLLFGTGLSIAQGLQVDIPNPMDWIKFVYKPFSDILYGLLK
ncbi:hypothetical protein [Pseudalkalibacillus salsuginis]|uniref:hypothetical protein n=1 Tax=Pseudalkalibacillus salsuginis TaxID=2910972 RepID=UPI001F394F30|nr:hypothetical protein [Pseudalkalibacillus salsuginis]MCF6409378.1 hypothetical protein [Pseudalkalibacillus salsuginis]